MSPRHLRAAPAARRPVAPVHKGPQAAPTSVVGAPYVHAPNAALLIDFDNVTMGIRSDLQGELKNLLSSDIIKGKVAVQRAYADWRRYPQYIVPLTESSIDLIYAPAYGSSKKNATDIRLAIDALELVFTRPEIGTFILLSGDSDFSSLVIKLKEYGKYVIGVGIRESSSDLLVMNCDEYYSYNALAGLVRSSDEEVVRWDPWELVREAAVRMVRDGDVMRADRLKQVMQEIDASFDEKDLGISKFSRFVQEAQAKGILTVTRLENGQYEIGLGDTGTAPAIAPATAADVETEGEEEEGDEVARGPERRGRRRRGGRGRSRDRDGRERTEERGEERDAERGAPVGAVAPVADATPAAPAPLGAIAPVGATRAPARGTPPAAPSGVPLGAIAPVGATRTAPPAAAPAAARPSSPADDHVGRSGERLTRAEAFDLVRRAVESLVEGDATTDAAAVRRRAYDLLGRDSESLAERMFERILKDAHDGEVIDLRRRGDGWEVSRVPEAESIAAQIEAKESALAAEAAAVAAQSAAPKPSGIAMRGVLPGRGRKATAAPPPELLLVGAVAPVGAVTSGASSAPATSAATSAGSEAPKTAEAATDAAPAATEPKSRGRKRGGRKTAAKRAAKAAAKASAAEVASTAEAAAPAPTARKAAKKTAAKGAKAEPAATKKAAKGAKKAARKTSAKKAAKSAAASAEASAEAPAKRAKKTARPRKKAAKKSAE